MVNLVCRSYFTVNCEVSSTVVNPRLGILMSAKLAIPAMHHLLFIKYKVSVSFRVLKNTYTCFMFCTQRYVGLIHIQIALTIIPECC